jgi:molybdopterin-guanine dinucleotide biosynthesis protein A
VANTERVFVCACDMPFVCVDLVEHLVRQLGEYDAAIPSDGTRLQPMHGIYHRRVLPLLEVRLNAYDL